MSVKIRLKRLGKIRVPQYRIVVVDSRKKRDGKVIEEIGVYRPKEDPSYISVVSERAQYWLGVGAQPSETVAGILKITGDWQTHKGISGTEGHLQVAPEKVSKLDRFNEALKEAGNEPKADAVTKKAAAKKPAKSEEKSDDAKAEAKVETPSEEAPREVPADETPEGATADAETAETAQVDAEKADDKKSDDEKPSA